jgi:uracil-DNA glycosylase
MRLDAQRARLSAIGEWLEVYNAIYEQMELEPYLTELVASATGVVRMMTADRDPVEGVPVLLVGEAPGADEDEAGWPFVGRSGQFLDRLLAEEAGVERANCWSTNLVHWRPVDADGRNRPPRAWEIEASLPYLMREIDLAQPAIVVTLGRFSTDALRPDAAISEAHGRVEQHERGFAHLPAFHPSYALRSAENELALRADLRVLRQLLDFARAAREGSA